jgi:hypothetical protein
MVVVMPRWEGRDRAEQRRADATGGGSKDVVTVVSIDCMYVGCTVLVLVAGVDQRSGWCRGVGRGPVVA